MSGIVTIPVLDFNKTLFTANFSNEEKIITSSMMSGRYNIMYYYIFGIR